MRNRANGSGGLYNVDGNRWASSALDDQQTGDLGGAQAPANTPNDKLVLEPGQPKHRMVIPAGLQPSDQDKLEDETEAQANNGYIF
jgi:hypothetical protein